jgi:hypothetical protein
MNFLALTSAIYKFYEANQADIESLIATAEKLALDFQVHIGSAPTLVNPPK